LLVLSSNKIEISPRSHEDHEEGKKWILNEQGVNAGGATNVPAYGLGTAVEGQ
jgi:hypothetical protein